MSSDAKDRHQKEYEQLLALFMAFLKTFNTDDEEEALYELMELRADLAISHAFEGFGIDVEEALLLVRNLDDGTLTQQDKDKRDRLVAAIDNLVEFAVCEEYRICNEARQLYDLKTNYNEDYTIDFDNPDDIDDYIDLCYLYNYQYAAVENGDIEYAMHVASKWILIASTEFLTYWTMNDNRVRPWHLALQGYTAKRDDFPAWMIPPIEWNCRCFLISGDGGEVVGYTGIKNVQAKAPEKPAQLNDIFSESVAKCGRIFSASHPYFDVLKNDFEKLDGCARRIRDKYYE